MKFSSEKQNKGQVSWFPSNNIIIKEDNSDNVRIKSETIGLFDRQCCGV